MAIATSSVNSSMESDGDGEDANVDVEGTEPSAPELFRLEPPHKQEVTQATARQEVTLTKPQQQIHHADKLPSNPIRKYT